eukprot:scaffold8235_cov155-Amphora_coffeaeformis.AAC.4
MTRSTSSTKKIINSNSMSKISRSGRVYQERQRQQPGLPKKGLSVLWWVWFWCVVAMQHVIVVDATIYTYNMSAPADQVELEFREAFPSLPGLFGQGMEDGRFYKARLQYLRDNAYLCDDEPQPNSKHDFVVPPDYIQSQMGNTETTTNATNNNNNYHHHHIPPHTSSSSSSFTPVAILAARGFCPFYNKAIVAESLGDAVQFLIVYNNDVDGEDVLVNMYSEYGSTRLILISVTHRTGQALKRYIAGQTPQVLAAGGPLIGFNDLPPEGIMTVEDLQNYVLSALGLFFMFVSVSGCILIWVGRRQIIMAGGPRIILIEGQPAYNLGGSNPQASTGRRLLTAAQIQQLVAASQQRQAQVVVDEEVVGPASLTTAHEEEEEEDCCAVCMEDFLEPHAEQSDTTTTTTLQLPCGHLFHTDCVVPWLTERQSKCPLCKFDVAEYVRQLQSEQQPGNHDGATTGWAAWNPLAWLRYRAWTAVAVEDGRRTTAGLDHHGGHDEEQDRQTVVIELADHSTTSLT